MVPASPAPDAAPVRRRRPRRSAEAVRACLIDAAVEEFSAKGFAGARTAEIAQRAGVVEPLLFKYFTSKANLFQIAVFETLNRNYDAFTAGDPASAAGQGDAVSLARAYIGQQHDFLRRHSRMFMSLIMRETYEGGEAGEGAESLSGLQAFLDRMSDFAAAHHHLRPGTDPRVLARISFASLLACALFGDWLFPAEAAGDAEIRAAIVEFMIKGADIYAPGD